MKQHSELTQAQKDAIALWERNFCGLLASMIGAANRANSAQLATFAALNVTPAIAELATDAVIPSARDYAGSQSLTAAEYSQAQTLAGQLNAMMLQNLALITKLIGVNAG